MVRNIYNKIVSYKDKIDTKLQLRELKKSERDDFRKIAMAFSSVLNDSSWQPSELEAFEKIYQLRKSYLDSTDKVLIRDFGAGDPNRKLSRQEQEQGIEVERILGEICKTAASPEKWGKLLFSIIRAFKPAVCLELGTNLGISAAYQISALKLNGKGKLFTLEGATELAKIADSGLKMLDYTDYSIETGRFKDTLPGVLSSAKSIDMAFIDGHHDKDATKEYFEQIFHFLSPNSILIFDDINWNMGMREAWKLIYGDNRITTSFDLGKWGICLIVNDLKNGHVTPKKLSI